METFRRKFRTRHEHPGRNESLPPSPGLSKAKITSMWHSLKYGKAAFSLDSNVTFSSHSPVWLLGRCYDKKLSSSHINFQRMSRKSKENGIEEFHEDFFSIIWFTYRRNIQHFDGTRLNTDCGWGCMLRSGQMLLCNALIKLHLGRFWRWKVPHSPVFTADDFFNETVHREVVRLFGDTSSSPLSIHQLVMAAGETVGKKAGDWFGPATTAHLLSAAVRIHGHCHDLLRNLRVYVAPDAGIYTADVYDMCTARADDGRSFDSLNLDEYSIIDMSELDSDIYTSGRRPPRKSVSLPNVAWTPVLILVPTKLGVGNRVNPVYEPCIRSMLASEHCVGIMGGRPRHSLFFVGFQDDNLLHLDPHLAQESVNMDNDVEFALDSYHCQQPRKLAISKMDPSCCFGFLIETEAQFQDLCELAQDSRGSSASSPIFSVLDGRGPRYASTVKLDMDNLVSIDEAGIDANLMIKSTEDEFVFL